MSWADDLDLMGPRVGTWWGSWALLAVSALSVVTMSSHRDDLLAAKETAQQVLDRGLRQQQARRIRDAALATSPTRAAVLPELSTLEGAAALVNRLSHPWPAVFASVESANEGVAILGLRHNSNEAIIDIEAVVADDKAAWRFVQVLGADTVRFQQASLLSREPLTAATHDAMLRIHAQAILAQNVAAVKPGASSR